MAQDGRVYDGSTITIGMDAETHPSILPAEYVSSCVNRSFRQGVNATRPPFTEIPITPAYGQDPSILTAFQTGNFQGAWPYKAIKSGSLDGFVVSVAGTIYFVSIVNNVGTLYKLISGNDPTMMHTWFVQAEDWVYIQNGYQDPIAWSGDISGVPTNLQAKGNGSTSIKLTWTNNAPGAIQNEIQVQYNGNIFTTVTSVPYSQTSYTYNTSSSTTQYEFQVRSVFPDGSSTPWSNIATTTAGNKTITSSQSNTIFRLNPVKQQMPIGTIMAYAYGRVSVSDANNNIYISDIIYGNGLTTTSNTQNFTEQTYWQEGGSFTPPANLGLITGMRIMPSLNINVRGQGELVIFCENGSFTLDLSQDRTTWQANNIQKVSLIGRGCRSPWSVCGINNDVYFRSDDGWTLYNNAQVDFSRSLSFQKISHAVQPWVNYDTAWLRQFESAMFFDNRLIATVSPFTVSTADPSVCGLHRPSRAMIVLDVEQEGRNSPDATIPTRWNGLWEGPQPTQLSTAQINGVQRGFAFSFDADNVNRLYELQSSSSLLTGVDDYSVKYGNVKIGSYFITKRYDFTPNQGASKFVRKQLVGGEVWVSNLKEAITLGCEFRPDSYACFNTLSYPITIGLNECTPITADCVPKVSQPRYQQLRFPTPDIDQCEMYSQIPLQEGAEFQVKINITGSCIVDRLRLAVIFNDSIDLPQGNCPDTFYNDPEPVQCACQPDLDYYRIVPLPTAIASVAG
jgi:hypothetical protein